MHILFHETQFPLKHAITLSANDSTLFDNSYVAPSPIFYPSQSTLPIVTLAPPIT